MYCYLKYSPQLDATFLSKKNCPRCLDFLSRYAATCEDRRDTCYICKPSTHLCIPCYRDLTARPALSITPLSTSPCQCGKVYCNGSRPQNGINSSDPYLDTDFDCPVVTNRGECPWRGKTNPMKSHIAICHMDIMILRDTIKLKDFRPSARYSRLCVTLGKVFCQYIFVTDDFFYTFVQCVGTHEEALEFRYNFKLCSRYKFEKYKYHNVISSVQESKCHILKSDKCVRYPYSVIKNYVDWRGTLPFGLEIYKCPVDNGAGVVTDR